MLQSFTITDPVYPIAFPDGNNTVTFATDKINLICGLNGTGKSTLLSHIAERFHAALSGRTLLCSENEEYHILPGARDKIITERGKHFVDDYKLMPNVSFKSDGLPIVSYMHPSFLIGGDSYVFNLCLGNHRATVAKQFEVLTGKKSYGQKHKAMVDDIFNFVKYGAILKDITIPKYSLEGMAWLMDSHSYREPMSIKHMRLLRDEYETEKENLYHLIVLDEPDSGMDIENMFCFWKKIEHTFDTVKNCQIIIASHSICPHLTISKEKINLIALSDIYKDPNWLTKYIK